MPDLSPVLGGVYTAYVPDDTQQMALGWVSVRFYRGSSETASPSLAGTVALVSGQKDYSYNDTAAVITDWFEYCLYDGASESQRSERVPIGPPRWTRKDIRQGVGSLLGTLKVVAIDTAGSSTTATINELIDPDASPHGYANRYARCVAGTGIGQTRRVRAGSTGYAVATGILTINRATSPAWVAADTLELWVADGDLDPSVEIDDAMQAVRSRLWWEDTWYFTTDVNVSEYAAPAMMRRDYIKRVERVTDSYPSRPHWEEIPWWDLNMNGAQPMLSIGSTIEGKAAFAAGEILRVVWNRFGDRMDSDTDSWDVPLEWAIAEVAEAYLQRRVRPHGGNEDTQDSQRSLSTIQEMRRNLRRTYMPSVAVGMIGPR